MVKIRSWAVLLAMALSSTGCAEILGSAVGSAVGEVVGKAAGDAAAEGTTSLVGEGPDAETPPSIYLAGPVPGWEHSTLRPAPSGAFPELFEANVFGGACPGLNLTGGTPEDPFSSGTPMRFDLFENAPSHTVDANYYRFGEVSLAGAPAPSAPWQFMGMYGKPAGACAFVGIPLLTIGPRPVHHIVFR